MGAAQIVPGHTLVSEGKAFYADRRPVSSGSTAGTGHGFCSCGEMSVSLPSAAQRKSWHRFHKASLGVTTVL